MPCIRNQKLSILVVVNCLIFNALNQNGLSFCNTIKNISDPSIIYLSNGYAPDPVCGTVSW